MSVELSFLRRAVLDQVAETRKQAATPTRDSKSYHPVVKQGRWRGRIVEIGRRSYHPDGHFIEGRSQAGNQRSTTHSKRKNAARKRLKVQRRKAPGG